MSDQLTDLSGRVAVVTGAAAGLGRAEAIGLARSGATVVVNDMAQALDASDVLDEISTIGAKAVAVVGDISQRSTADELIDCADGLGGLSIVVNNAGITRDRMLFNMTDEDWDAVIEVHLRGAFNVTRATVEHFRNQGEGSYVLFTSTSGLIGNIGQANYAAAKLGVMGLSRIIAMEGAIKSVRSNIIAPFAWTRMIATIPVKDEASAARVDRMKNGMRADQVAQLAVALASPEAKAVSGQVFSVRGNEIVLFDQPRPVRSVSRMEGWTPASILEQAMPSMGASFTDLGATGSVFPYDPV